MVSDLRLILSVAGEELYELQVPRNDTLTFEVLDVQAHLRHLVLDVTGERLPIGGRFLCGHDEFHWFVAQVPWENNGTVRRAMESLKPEIVLREQRRQGVFHQKTQRKTKAYIRQGEWFFIPRPKMIVDEQKINFRGELKRKGGKPHRVEQLYREPVKGEQFVRGLVSHKDHQTINLECWHRVVENNEVKEKPQVQEFQRMKFVD